MRCAHVILLAALCLGQTGTAADDPKPATSLDTILVIGEVPGPALWKVTNGDNVLWIVGTLSPITKNISWRTREIESILAHSQEVIGVSEGYFDFKIRSEAHRADLWSRVKDIPEEKQLFDVLPANLYTKWISVVNDFGEDSEWLERRRPRFAAEDLFVSAVDRAGLTIEPLPWTTIRALALKHRVRIVTNDFKLLVPNPKKEFEAMEHAPIESEFACLSDTLDRLQNDIQSMKLRANAWAVGDLDALRDLPYRDQWQACWQTFSNIEGMADTVRKFKERLVSDWVHEAAHALTHNKSTIALLPIDAPYGLGERLEALRQLGYTVVPPQRE
jgi:uncharacterized protein YbaP (TraB family)